MKKPALDRGLPRRFAPRNDSKNPRNAAKERCHSEPCKARRGNPSPAIRFLPVIASLAKQGVAIRSPMRHATANASLRASANTGVAIYQHNLELTTKPRLPL